MIHIFNREVRFIQSHKLQLFYVLLAFSLFAPKGHTGNETIELELKPLPEQSTIKEQPIGLALFHIDADGVAPSMAIVRLTTKDNVLSLRNGMPIKSGKEHRISLKNLELGYYTLSLEPGVYQITEVNSPAFNLPYMKSTNLAAGWRFRVSASNISYIGSIFIDSERKKNYVEMQLRNRLATDLDAIENAASLFPQRTLVPGRMVNDYFYTRLLNEN